jgi:hypothetical protein
MNELLHLGGGLAVGIALALIAIAWVQRLPGGHAQQKQD